MDVPEEIQKLTSDKKVKENKTTKDNNEISINYVTRKRWNRTNIVVVNIFAYNIDLDIISENEDPKQKSVEKCQERKYWYL